MEIDDFSNAISGTQIGGAYHIYIRPIFHYFSGLCKGISPQNME
jgi:hypothetical protein